MKLSVFYDHILDAHEQTGREIPDLLKEVRECGIEALEIRLSHLTEEPRLPEWLKKFNLSVSCIFEFYEMGTCDETEKIRLHLETAKAFASPNIMIVPGFLHGADADKVREVMPDEAALYAFFDSNEEVKNMAAGLNQATTMAKEYGIQVVFEDFDDFSSPMSGANGVAWFLEHCPGIGFTFDCGNFIMHKEDILAAYERFHTRVRHVHCKDRSDDAVATGDGFLPIREIVTSLQKEGYTGFFAVEHFGAKDQMECIRRSAAFLKSIAIS